MRIKKRIIIISVFLLFSSICLLFLINYLFNIDAQLINDLLVGVITSAITVIILTLGEYQIVKRQLLEELVEFAIDFRNLINKFKYKIDDSNMEAVLKNFENLGSFNLAMLNKIYGDIDFIFANCTLRDWIHINIYQQINSSINDSARIRHYIKNENGLNTINIDVWNKYFLEFRETIFKVETNNNSGNKVTIVYNTKKDNLDNSIEYLISKINKTKYEPIEKFEPVSYISENNIDS